MEGILLNRVFTIGALAALAAASLLLHQAGAAGDHAALVAQAGGLALDPSLLLGGLALAGILTEGTHAGEFLVSEANGSRSREAVTILSGQDLEAGAVLGKTLTGGSASATAFAGNTGNGAMGAITVSGAAKIGAYKLVIVEPAANAGAFVVEDPDGVVIGRGNVAAAFSAGGLAFTLADGATDFVAGDGFSIAVTGTEKYKEYDPGNTDGSEKAVAVLYDAVDASAADADGVAIVRDAEVNGAELVWFSGATADQKTAGKADLARAGIIAR